MCSVLLLLCFPIKQKIVVVNPGVFILLFILLEYFCGHSRCAQSWSSIYIYIYFTNSFRNLLSDSFIVSLGNHGASVSLPSIRSHRGKRHFQDYLKMYECSYVIWGAKRLTAVMCQSSYQSQILSYLFPSIRLKKILAQRGLYHEILVYLFRLWLTGSCQQEMLLPLLVNPSCSPSGSVWETSVNPTISLSYSTHSEDMNTDSSQPVGEFPTHIITFTQTCGFILVLQDGEFFFTIWNLSHDLNLLNM